MSAAVSVSVEQDDALGDVGPMLGRVPYPVQLELVDEIDRKEPTTARRALRRVLVSWLNARRQDRGFRLFTTLFEPVLCRDVALLSATQAIPGLVTLGDVRALWDVMGEGPGALVNRGLDMLNARALNDPLERVFASEGGRALVLAWRGAALDILGQAARDLTAAHGRETAWLVRFGKARQAWLGRKAPALAAFRADERTIAALVDALAVYDRVRSKVGEIEQALAARPGQSALERLAETMGRGQRDLVALALERRFDEGSGLILPLSVLHRRRAYPLIAMAIRRRPGDVLVRPLREGVLGHYTAATSELIKVLQLGQVLEGDGFVAVDGDRLDGALDWWSAVISGLSLAGIVSEESYEKLFREPWQDLWNAVTQGLMVRVKSRWREAVGAMYDRTGDFGDVCHLVSFVLSWASILRRVGYEPRELTEWVSALTKELHIGFDRASKSAGIYGSLSDQERFGYLVRLFALSLVVKADVKDWFSRAALGLQRAMTARLVDYTPLDDEEVGLLSQFIAFLEQGSGAKGWSDPTLKDIISLARERGL